MAIRLEEATLDLHDVILLLRFEERQRIADVLLIGQLDTATRLLIGGALSGDPVPYCGGVASKVASDACWAVVRGYSRLAIATAC